CRSKSCSGDSNRAGCARPTAHRIPRTSISASATSTASTTTSCRSSRARHNEARHHYYQQQQWWPARPAPSLLKGGTSMKHMQRISGGLIAIIGACALLGTQAMAQSASGLAFRNTVKPPPPGWTGPVFKLSRDYPTTISGDCAECTWLKVDVDFS